MLCWPDLSFSLFLRDNCQVNLASKTISVGYRFASVVLSFFCKKVFQSIVLKICKIWILSGFILIMLNIMHFNKEKTTKWSIFHIKWMYLIILRYSQCGKSNVFEWVQFDFIFTNNIAPFLWKAATTIKLYSLYICNTGIQCPT